MNCSFNIRYKPRTTRVFTKSDLTVYDSAGNTALNALTVYGKSEVVDGAIVSAGEGWATVDLGTLTWQWWSDHPNILYAVVSDKQIGLCGMMCSAYPYRQDISFGFASESLLPDKTIYCSTTPADTIFIKNTDYSTKEDFVASLGDATLAYQLADPTQGNCIAVKTDDGTGIDGTMAVFETGTPLYGIPDTNVRDVMAWDGSSGKVTKNCGETYPAQENIIYWSANDVFILTSLNFKFNSSLMCSKFQYKKVATSWNELLDGEFGNTPNTVQIGFKYSQAQGDIDVFKAYINNMPLIYELATPTTEQLTTAENDSIAGLMTFTPQTHAQNNAGAEMTVDYTIRVPTI